MLKALLLVLSLIMSTGVKAEPDMSCWGNPVEKTFVTISGTSFGVAKKGSKSTAIYYSPLGYNAVCNNLNGYFNVTTMYFKSEMFLPASELNPGYYRLSDDIDIKIMMNLASKPVSPFIDSIDIGGFVDKGEEVPITFSVGSQGDLDLVLRHDIIGGAIIIPEGVKVANLYRKAYLPPHPLGEYASAPVMDIHMKGQLIEVPVLCNINNGNDINVEFGRMAVDHISQSSSGLNYSRDLDLNISCTSAMDQELKINFIGSPSSFDNNAFISSNPDIAFTIRHNGNVVPPWGNFSTLVTDGFGRGRITLSPVRNAQAATIALGDVSASITLVVSLP